MATIRPHAPVRRFDVFAEYTRLKAMREDGMKAAKAKGQAIWLAKVVAAQKYGILPRPSGERRKENEKRRRGKWHDLSGVPQTDVLFDTEIIGRLGRDFYSHVFSPAIKRAYDEGKRYEDIRDSIRRDWKP
jgi:hypothetical protein